jgi:hypothetical protein
VTYFYSELSARLKTGSHVNFLSYFCGGSDELVRGKGGGGGEDYFKY